MSPRRLAELERRERQSLIAHLVVRILVIVALLLGAYYVIPVGDVDSAGAVLRLLLGLLVFVAVLLWQMRKILRSDLPELQAIEALALVLPFFLVLFAQVYSALANASPSAFSEPLSRTGALYFVVTVFSTVGFGDITPETDGARILVALQMLIDLVLIGAVARLLFTAAKAGLSRSDESSSTIGPADDG